MPSSTLTNSFLTTDTLTVGPTDVVIPSVPSHKSTLSPTATGGIAAATTLAVVAIIAVGVACILFRKRRLEQGHNDEDLGKEQHHKIRQEVSSEERVELAADGLLKIRVSVLDSHRPATELEAGGGDTGLVLIDDMDRIRCAGSSPEPGP